jgi:hypothetical protein
MTTEQAKEIFNQAIDKMDDADAIARMEVAREYFTNTEFRRWLQDYLWQTRKQESAQQVNT